MAWDPERDDQSTYKPLTREQIEILRRNHVEPRLQEVHEVHNEISRRPPQPVPAPRPKGPVYH